MTLVKGFRQDHLDRLGMNDSSLIDHRPDWAQVLGTVVVLLTVAGVAWFDIGTVQMHVDNVGGGDAAVDELMREPLHRTTAWVAEGLGFPLATVTGWVFGPGIVTFVAYLANIAALAYGLRWAMHALWATRPAR